MRTIEIDVRFVTGHVEGRPTFVRVKQATGVTKRKAAKEVRDMVRLLWRQPQHRHIVFDLARPINDSRRRKLTDVYFSYLSGRLVDLSASFEDRELVPLIDEWLADFQASESHRFRCRQALKQMCKTMRGTAKLSDLPTMLEEYRTRCVREGTPSAFRYAKQTCNALLRDKVGKRHPLKVAVSDVPGMPEAKQGVLGVTVDEAREVRRRLSSMVSHVRVRTVTGRFVRGEVSTRAGEEAARIWWAMCCTGMGATEMWGEWTVLPDRIRIRGTKRPGRRWGTTGREVPLLCTVPRPTLSKDRFAKLLHRAGATPYQGRHSYACWLEDAGVQRALRKLLLGHGAGDVTGLYEKREITKFLAEITEKMVAFIGPETRLDISRTAGFVAAPIAQEARA